MNSLSRYCIHLAFDGTRYHGWQQQPNAESVQQVLTNALALLLRQPVALTGCGRTDTGVHAEDFYAHFDLNMAVTTGDLPSLSYRLNHFLSQDIVIYEILPVPLTWHARFSALSRTYRYRISRKKNPFNRSFSYAYYFPLDIDLMNRGADFLLSLHDFTSFSKIHTDTKTNICRVFQARWEEEKDELVFTIRADRFLRNMVRAIVGTLLDLGENKISYENLIKIAASKNRSEAGQSVPACGLSLVHVEYTDWD